MITELRRMQVATGPGRSVWIVPDLWLFCLRVELPVGERYEVYRPSGHPFASAELDDGEIGALRSATVIAPGGRIKVHNAALAEPTIWEGSLNPVCNGVIIKALVEFEAEIPSVMTCISPPGDLSRFAGKALRREVVLAGSNLTFLPGDVGYAVAYGEGEMQGFAVLPGDVFSPQQDTVVAVVSEVSQ